MGRDEQRSERDFASGTVPRTDDLLDERDLQPETQGADPVEMELGEDGQGDLSAEDVPSATGDGPEDLRTSDQP